MHILTPLVIGLFAIHSHAVLHEATDLKDFDFIPFQKVERYREYEKSRGKIEFQDDQRCPCGKELLNAMILVYFDQYGRNGTVKKSLRPRRFLVSQQQMGSGAFARVSKFPFQLPQYPLHPSRDPRKAYTLSCKVLILKQILLKQRHSTQSLFYPGLTLDFYRTYLFTRLIHGHILPNDLRKVYK
jgi:hypothetical protein